MPCNEELIQAYKETGDASLLNEIIERNIDLVKMICNKYTPPTYATFDDLLQEGLIGLMDAVHTYDPDNEKAAAFSTWAVFHIRSKLSHYMDWSKRIKNQQCISLYEELTDGVQPIQVIDQIEDEKAQDFFKLIELQELRRGLENAMECLNLRQREVIKLAYGWTCDPCSFADVGRVLGCSRENIRQQHDKAINKLRETEYCKQLIDERQEEYDDYKIYGRLTAKYEG